MKNFNDFYKNVLENNVLEERRGYKRLQRDIERIQSELKDTPKDSPAYQTLRKELKDKKTRFDYVNQQRRARGLDAGESQGGKSKGNTKNLFRKDQKTVYQGYKDPKTGKTYFKNTRTGEVLNRPPLKPGQSPEDLNISIEPGVERGPHVPRGQKKVRQTSTPKSRSVVPYNPQPPANVDDDAPVLPKYNPNSQPTSQPTKSLPTSQPPKSLPTSQPPSGGNPKPPSGGGKPPSSGNPKPPSGGGKPPSGGKPKPPSGGKPKPPSSGGKPPSSGGKPPSSGGKPPSGGKPKPPSGGGKPPSGGKPKPPSGGGKPPSGGGKPPSGGAIPSGSSSKAGIKGYDLSQSKTSKKPDDVEVFEPGPTPATQKPGKVGPSETDRAKAAAIRADIKLKKLQAKLDREETKRTNRLEDKRLKQEIRRAKYEAQAARQAAKAASAEKWGARLGGLGRFVGGAMGMPGSYSGGSGYQPSYPAVARRTFYEEGINTSMEEQYKQKEKLDTLQFIKSVGEKNYSEADKYLKELVNNKLTQKINKYKSEKPF